MARYEFYFDLTVPLDVPEPDPDNECLDAAIEKAKDAVDGAVPHTIELIGYQRVEPEG